MPDDAWLHVARDLLDTRLPATEPERSIAAEIVKQNGFGRLTTEGQQQQIQSAWNAAHRRWSKQRWPKAFTRTSKANHGREPGSRRKPTKERSDANRSGSAQRCDQLDLFEEGY